MKIRCFDLARRSVRALRSRAIRWLDEHDVADYALCVLGLFGPPVMMVLVGIHTSLYWHSGFYVLTHPAHDSVVLFFTLAAATLNMAEQLRRLRDGRFDVMNTWRGRPYTYPMSPAVWRWALRSYTPFAILLSGIIAIGYYTG